MRRTGKAMPVGDVVHRSLIRRRLAGDLCQGEQRVVPLEHLQQVLGELGAIPSLHRRLEICGHARLVGVPGRRVGSGPVAVLELPLADAPDELRPPCRRAAGALLAAQEHGLPVGPLEPSRDFPALRDVELVAHPCEEGGDALEGVRAQVPQTRVLCHLLRRVDQVVVEKLGREAVGADVDDRKLVLVDVAVLAAVSRARGRVLLLADLRRVVAHALYRRNSLLALGDGRIRLARWGVGVTEGAGPRQLLALQGHVRDGPEHVVGEREVGEDAVLADEELHHRVDVRGRVIGVPRHLEPLRPRVERVRVALALAQKRLGALLVQAEHQGAVELVAVGQRDVAEAEGLVDLGPQARIAPLPVILHVRLLVPAGLDRSELEMSSRVTTPTAV